MRLLPRRRKLRKDGEADKDSRVQRTLNTTRSENGGECSTGVNLGCIIIASRGERDIQLTISIILPAREPIFKVRGEKEKGLDVLKRFANCAKVDELITPRGCEFLNKFYKRSWCLTTNWRLGRAFVFWLISFENALHLIYTRLLIRKILSKKFSYIILQ